MAVYYLDADEEVTGAVARLRSASEQQVALVLPAGSRVATSRINFRLLFREAESNGKRLAVVSADSSVRSIAVAAGLQAYPTVAAYEEIVEAGGQAVVGPIAAAEVQIAEVPVPAAPTGGPPSGIRQTGGRDVRGAAGAAAAAGTVPGAVEPPTPAAAEGPIRPGGKAAARGSGALPVVGGIRPDKPRRSSRRRAALVLGGVGGLLVAGAVAAWLILPAADIVVTPLGEPAGPVSLNVTADPSVDAVDAEKGIVPANRVEFPLAAKGTFKSSGSRVDETAAAGSVRFSSNNPLDPVTIPVGTTVATSGGIQFQTVATVVAPKATISGSTITAGRVDARVKAVAPGPSGNVGAGKITVVPSRLKNFLVSVTNPAATTGGARTETKFVTKEDYAAATATLDGRLDSELTEAVASPTIVPAGTTVFPETAQRGRAEYDPLAADLVGSEVPTFELTAAATGSVVTVDEKLIAPVAEARLTAQIADGYELFEGSIRTQVGDGTVNGETIVFPVQAVGEQWRPVAAADLVELVRGKPEAEAKSLLLPYGDVVITLWPDFVDTIPTMDGRVTITIAPPRRAGS
jgi:hypothetical protein